MGHFLLLRLDCKSHSWDSLNRWLMLVPDDRFPHSPLWVKIRNDLLLASRSGSMCKVLPAASSHSLFTDPGIISVGRVKELLCGLDCLTPKWKCILWRHSSPLRNLELTVFRQTHSVVCCPPYFSKYPKFVSFLCWASIFFPWSQCESLHTILLFPSEWGLLTKPLCLHLGEKKAKYRYILFSFLFTSKF